MNWQKWNEEGWGEGPSERAFQSEHKLINHMLMSRIDRKPNGGVIGDNAPPNAFRVPIEQSILRPMAVDAFKREWRKLRKFTVWPCELSRTGRFMMSGYEMKKIPNYWMYGASLFPKTYRKLPKLR